MKKHLFIYLFFMLCQSLVAQTAWDKTYSASSPEEAKFLLPTGTGYLVAIQNNNTVFLQKINGIGQFLSKKIIAQGQVVAMQKSDNQQHLLWLMASDSTAILKKTDSLGTKIDSFYFGNAVKIVPQGIIEDPTLPNHYYIAAIDKLTSQVVIYNLAFDSQGNVTTSAAWTIGAADDYKRLFFKKINNDVYGVFANVNAQKTKLLKVQLGSNFSFLQDTILSNTIAPNAISKATNTTATYLAYRENGKAKTAVFNTANSSLSNNYLQILQYPFSEISSIKQQGNELLVLGNYAQNATFSGNTNVFLHRYDVNKNLVQQDTTHYQSQELGNDFLFDNQGVTLVGKRNSQAFVSHNFPKNYHVKGFVFYDKNNNCQYDAATDTPLNAWEMRLDKNNQSVFQNTDANGNFAFNTAQGNHVLSVKLPNGLWQPCQNNLIFNVLQPDTLTFSFAIKANDVAPQLNVEIQKPPFNLQTGQTMPYLVTFENTGSAAANNAYVDVTYEDLDFVNGSQISTPIGNGRRFNLGTVNVSQKDSFLVFLKPKINVLQGKTLCVEANIRPNDYAQAPANWSSAYLRTSLRCANGKVYIDVTNLGNGPSTPNRVGGIIEEEVMIKTIKITNPILPNTTQTIDSMPANGHFYHVFLDQEPNYPGGNKTGSSIEACGTPPTFGLYNKFPYYDTEPFRSVNCTPLGAPNNTLQAYQFALQTGVGAQNHIDSNAVLTYYFVFQNTTNQAITDLKLQNTINDFWQKEKIENNLLAGQNIGYSIQNQNTLQYDFSTISIAPQSYAYCSFKVPVKKNLTSGTIINNQAIFISNNQSVTTNTVFHTIKNEWIVTPVTTFVRDEKEKIEVKIFPNPFDNQAFVLIESIDYEEITQLQIINQQGQMMQKTATNGEKLIAISRENLSSGLYFVRLLDKKGKVVFIGKITAMN